MAEETCFGCQHGQNYHAITSGTINGDHRIGPCNYGGCTCTGFQRLVPPEMNLRSEPAWSRWNRMFAGKWCVLHARAGTGIEGHVFEVDEHGVYLSELLNVYPDLPPVMTREAVIEVCVAAVPLADVDWIRVAARARAEKLCRAINTTHLVRPQRQN